VAKVAAVQIPGVKLEAVRVSPELGQVLVQARKKEFKSEPLRAVLSYRQNIPLLRLKTGKQVALEPIRAERMPTAQEKAAAAKVPADTEKYIAHIRLPWIDIIRRVRVVLPLDTVDHRTCQTAIRDQLDRQTCVAHASMAGLEGFYKCKQNVTRDLSENHTYHIFMQREASTCRADPGIQTWRAAGYLSSQHVCAESAMPYTNMAGVPTNDATHVPAGCSGSAPYGFADTQVIFGTAFGGDPTVNANNTNYLESLLASGYDIVYGTYMAGNDWHDGTAETGIVDVQMIGGAPAPAWAGHAMLLVGYNRSSQYFIFKNSWGTDFGRAGYVYVSYNYLQTYGKYGYIIKSVTP